MVISNYKSDAQTASVIMSATSSQYNYLKPVIGENNTEKGITEVTIFKKESNLDNV